MDSAEIGKNKRAKSISWWIPKIVFISIIICGILVWVVWSYIRQMQLYWIPEATFWYRLGVSMGEGWYIPLISGIIGVLSFILLEKVRGKRSE